MTLPKNFGSGQECNTCGKSISRYDNECPHCKKANRKYIIPVTKMGISILVFQIAFYGGAIGMFVGGLIGDVGTFVLSLFSIMVSTMIMLMGTMDCYRNMWKIRKKGFFIFVPLVNYFKKFNFKDE